MIIEFRGTFVIFVLFLLKAESNMMQTDAAIKSCLSKHYICIFILCYTRHSPSIVFEQKWLLFFPLDSLFAVMMVTPCSVYISLIDRCIHS